MYKEIVQYPNPILRKKSLPINKNFQNLELLVASLKKVAKKNSKNGIVLVGLSAPQLSVNARVFVFFDNKTKSYKEVINPEIIELSDNTSIEWEGCASVGVGKKGLVGPVKRSSFCIIEYFDLCWQRKILSAKGVLSHVILHEIDHLDGILFLDKLVDQKYLMTFDDLEKYMAKNNGRYPQINQ